MTVQRGSGQEQIKKGEGRARVFMWRMGRRGYKVAFEKGLNGTMRRKKESGGASGERTVVSVTTKVKRWE